MADTRMSREEREHFLAGLHVGVLALPREDGSPLTAPIWYGYEPGGNVWVLTGPDSQKGRLLEVGLPVTLVAQEESLPYRYVSVEGVVASVESDEGSDNVRQLAHRYLGEEVGDAYAAANAGNANVRVEIEPRRWLSVDYGKAGPG